MAQKKIYLTFNDSPSTACQKILDLLKDKAHATFFLRAERLKAVSESHALIQRMVKEGHTLGITLSHAANLTELSKNYQQDLEAFKKLFAQKGGTFPGFKVARLSGSNVTDPAYVKALGQQLSLPQARWNFELAPNDKLKHLQHSGWQQLTGVYASSPDLPKADDIVLLHSPHWLEQHGLLAKVLAKLQASYEIASLTPLPVKHSKLDFAPDPRPRICLTFDDGPYPITPDVVDSVKGLKATFFINMKWMQGSPDEQYSRIRKILDGGHSLGTHGFDHDPTGMDQYKAEYKSVKTESVKQDFLDNLSALRKLMGRMEAPKIWNEFNFRVARLPGDGKRLPAFVDMITNELKLVHVGWNFEFRPNSAYEGPYQKRVARFKKEHPNETPPERDFVLDWMQLDNIGASPHYYKLPKDGHIVLLHDNHWATTGTIKQLQALIEKLNAETQIIPLEALLDDKDQFPANKEIKSAFGQR